MDLDFTSHGIVLGELKAGLRRLLDNKTAYGIGFKVIEENVSASPITGTESYIAIIKYTHSWNPGSEFQIEVSYREEPILLPFQLFDPPNHTEG